MGSHLAPFVLMSSESIPEGVDERTLGVHICSLSLFVAFPFHSVPPTSSQVPVAGTSSSKAVILNRGHLAMSGDFFLSQQGHWVGGVTSTLWEKSGMLLNILQGIGQPLPLSKNYPAQDVNSTHVRKPCSKQREKTHVLCRYQIQCLCCPK